MSFSDAFATTVGLEGRYSNNPNDPGGETVFGITERVARANGYQGPMGQMPLALAENIYKIQYWDVLSLGEIDLASSKISAKLFNIGVNCGIERAGTFLQIALNAFNKGAKLYPDVLVDGNIGKRTIEAFHMYFLHRPQYGEEVLFRAINAQQGTYYLNIAKTNQKLEDFEFGWFLQRVN